MNINKLESMQAYEYKQYNLKCDDEPTKEQMLDTLGAHYFNEAQKFKEKKFGELLLRAFDIFELNASSEEIKEQYYNLIS